MSEILNFILTLVRNWLNSTLFHKSTSLEGRRYIPSVNATEPLKICDPVNDIFFLKTHKCASSSLQNIFMRFGQKHNLTFVLPSWGNYLGYPRKFYRDLMVPHPSGTYNIFCHHTRWNDVEIRAIMPKAKFISVLRHPATVLESFYSFSKFQKRYHVNFDTFIQNPKKYNVKALRATPPSRNTMLYDFGLDTMQFEDVQSIQMKIDKIKQAFDLIMIAERFDESLILLRDLLCWSWDDVVVFKQNSRIKTVSLTALQTDLVEKWSWADMMLYKTFYNIFEEKVHQYGAARMQRDLAILRNLTTLTFNHCVDDLVRKNEILDPKFKSWSADVYNFKLKSNDSKCFDLAKSELPFTTELKRKIWPDRKFIV